MVDKSAKNAILMRSQRASPRGWVVTGCVAKKRNRAATEARLSHSKKKSLEGILIMRSFHPESEFNEETLSPFKVLLRPSLKRDAPYT